MIPRRSTVRPSARSACPASSCSALIVILVVGALTARLFYLQVADGPAVRRARDAQPDGPRADSGTARPHPRPHGPAARDERPDVRGEDPAGRPAELRSATTVVERPRRAACDGSVGHPTRRSTATSDRAFDLVRIAQDVDEATARLISESGARVPRRRGRGRGAALATPRGRCSPRCWATPVRYPRAVAATCGTTATCRTTSIGKAGLEADLRGVLRGTYGSERSSVTPPGRRDAGPRDRRGGRARRSAATDDRHRSPARTPRRPSAGRWT